MKNSYTEDHDVDEDADDDDDRRHYHERSSTCLPLENINGLIQTNQKTVESSHLFGY